MKNPILITLNDNSHVEVGDPFVLRFNGKYYLYCSTCDDAEGIRCFISDDLINYTYYGLVAESPLLSYAYAPEVILHNDEFIMVTSPKGNGHYFLKSNSPLGPFEFITDNLKNMIDGSLVLDKNNELHFLRADHNGIAYLDFKNNKLSNRKDILPQISNAWTEGPSMTYFNGHYYITYCGNDVLSPSYRVKVACSKNMDSHYIVSPSPLLLSTQEGFAGHGHNSVVLGPNLDEYYVAYHKLDWVNERQTTRYLCLNRLYFNLSDCTCNASNFEVMDPKRPDFEGYASDLELVEEKLLSSEITDKKYTAEFNFKGFTDVILGYQDEDNYSIISFKEKIEIYDIFKGTKILRKTITSKFNFNHFHTLRVINDLKCELLIDNVHFHYTSNFHPGKLGYGYKEEGLHYTAFTNSVYTKSMINVPHIVPGKIEANYTDTKIHLKSEEEIYSMCLKKDDCISYKVVCKESGIYKLFAKMANITCNIEVSTSKTSETITLKANESEYHFNYRFITNLHLDCDDEVTIKVLSGKFDFRYLMTQSLLECSDEITPAMLENSGEYYLFTKSNNQAEIFFELTGDCCDNLFGLIFNATNYTSWHSNKTLKCLGYFVGFDNGLLVVDYCQYDRSRIYDKPYRLLPDKTYSLKVLIKDNLIYVYINNKLEISTSLKYDQGYGLSGVYKSKHSNVKILEYKDGDQ